MVALRWEMVNGMKVATLVRQQNSPRGVNKRGDSASIPGVTSSTDTNEGEARITQMVVLTYYHQQVTQVLEQLTGS